MERVVECGYKIQRQVYESGSSVVYQCIHPSVNMLFALKVQTFAVREVVHHSYREVFNMMKIGHPNAIKLYWYSYYETPDGKYQLAMLMDWGGVDLMRDVSLRSAAGRKYTESELRLIAYSLLHALAEAERLGIAHRGIKPQNVLVLMDQQEIRIGDFGLSSNRVKAENPCTHIERQWGMVSHSEFDSLLKSDVYSLGMTLLTAALLQPPNWLINADSDPVLLEDKFAGLEYSDEVKGMIRSMMNVMPSDRPTFLELERKYCPLTGSSQCIVVEIEEDSTTYCAGCRKYSRDNGDIPVMIDCACGINSFCSRQCFETYVEGETCGYAKETVACPRCGRLLNQGQVVRLCGGSGQYQRLAEKYAETQLQCVLCKQRRADYYLSCGHIHCKCCLETERLLGHYFCVLCNSHSAACTEITTQSFLSRLLGFSLCGNR